MNVNSAPQGGEMCITMVHVGSPFMATVWMYAPGKSVAINGDPTDVGSGFKPVYPLQ